MNLIKNKWGPPDHIVRGWVVILEPQVYSAFYRVFPNTSPRIADIIYHSRLMSFDLIRVCPDNYQAYFRGLDSSLHPLLIPNLHSTDSLLIFDHLLPEFIPCMHPTHLSVCTQTYYDNNAYTEFDIMMNPSRIPDYDKLQLDLRK